MNVHVGCSMQSPIGLFVRPETFPFAGMPRLDSVELPIVREDMHRPPSSRVKGCVLAQQMMPRVA